ncbi:hypothetical protein MRB53_038452 [Persea americana]|nr:hypothetical protein MRB53_038452 [Persea americana]
MLGRHCLLFTTFFSDRGWTNIYYKMSSSASKHRKEKPNSSGSGRAAAPRKTQQYGPSSQQADVSRRRNASIGADFPLPSISTWYPLEDPPLNINSGAGPGSEQSDISLPSISTWHPPKDPPLNIDAGAKKQLATLKSNAGERFCPILPKTAESPQGNVLPQTPSESAKQLNVPGAVSQPEVTWQTPLVAEDFPSDDARALLQELSKCSEELPKCSHDLQTISKNSMRVIVLSKKALKLRTKSFRLCKEQVERYKMLSKRCTLLVKRSKQLDEQLDEQKKQLDEQKKQLDEQKKQLDEQKKQLDEQNKHLVERNTNLRPENHALASEGQFLAQQTRTTAREEPDHRSPSKSRALTPETARSSSIDCDAATDDIDDDIIVKPRLVLNHRTTKLPLKKVHCLHPAPSHNGIRGPRRDGSALRPKSARIRKIHVQDEQNDGKQTRKTR